MLRTVMVVSGGGFQGLALVKALRAAGPMRIVLIDCHAENITRYHVDAFYQAPRLDQTERFLDFCLELCRAEGIEAIFASTDYDLPLLAEHKNVFTRAGIVAYVSSPELLRLARDKGAFYIWLEKQGIPVLPFYSSPRAQGASFPLIGKPRHG